MLRGYLDRAARHHIMGWALNEAEPDVYRASAAISKCGGAVHACAEQFAQ